jgi:competence protein ComEA
MSHTGKTSVATLDDMPALPLSRRQALVVAGALALVLVLAGKLLAGGGSAHRARAYPFQRAAPPAPPPLLVVDVAGAVRRPGLYRLRQGSRIADALAKAGGATAKAAVEGVNLAAPLADGEQIVVPLRASGGSADAAPGAGAGPPATTGPVSLSTASSEQLDALPGIGPVTAQKIVDYRTEHGAFQSVDELDAISGIGPAKLDQLRDLVVP